MPIVPTDKELYTHFSGNSKGIRGTARFSIYLIVPSVPQLHDIEKNIVFEYNTKKRFDNSGI